MASDKLIATDGQNRLDALEQRKETKSKAKKNEDTVECAIARVDIPPLEIGLMSVRLVGHAGLLVNNKMNVAAAIADQYDGSGKTSKPKPAPLTTDEQYANAFYVLPSSKHHAPHPQGRYGVPTSGIKKCLCKATRTTGITDNTTVGLIAKSFFIASDDGQFCEVKFDKLERDIRTVNIGSGAKTVPSMRHRPMFMGWSILLNLRFNRRVLSPDMIINLAMHAGEYIGLCEMRAEKIQGECGGFRVKQVG